jgi:CheY-like chemotaxis protein
MTTTSHDSGEHRDPEDVRDGRGDHLPDCPEKPRRLLVAEDDEDTSFVLRKWLEEDGYEVTIAGCGWEAVQLALRGGYDAILMDMSLPAMDGMSAVHLIRAHEGLSRVPVVAITAYGAAYPRAEALEAMCDEYLVKPLDLGSLGAVLRRVLG